MNSPTTKKSAHLSPAEKDHSTRDEVAGGDVIVGAVNFKNWHIAVWVSGPDLTFPETCTCCLSERDVDTQELTQEDGGILLTYPICENCREHAKLDDIAIGLSLGIGAVVIVGLWYQFGFLFLRRALILSVIVYGILWVLLSGGVYYFLGNRKKKPDCPDSGWPVELIRDPDLGPILGKESERTDERLARQRLSAFKAQSGAEGFALGFRNPRYAARFFERNSGTDVLIEYIEEKL